MADQDVIIQIGSSNMAGFLANLYDVPNADYQRWVSLDTPTSGTTKPYNATVPGVKLWTPRRPYSLNSQRPIASATTTSTTYVGPITSPASTSV